MFNFFKNIDYTFKTKNGIKDTGGLVSSIFFGQFERLFIISFIMFGILTFGLGFVSFYFSSNIALFFSILFLLIFFFDIWLFKKVKSIFGKVSKKTVDYSRKQSKKILSGNIVDVDYE